MEFDQTGGIIMDWKRKLTSRKFWVAVVGFVTALLVVFGIDGITQQQVNGVVSALVPLVAYIFGEGIADSKKGNDNKS